MRPHCCFNLHYSDYLRLWLFLPHLLTGEGTVWENNVFLLHFLALTFLAENEETEV